MKTNLSMILIKKNGESGVKNATLFLKFETKKYLPEGKMGFRAFALNSKKVSKHHAGEYWALKMPHYSEQINCSRFFVLRFASTNIFLFIK